MIGRLTFVAIGVAVACAVTRSRWYHDVTMRRLARRRLRNL